VTVAPLSSVHADALALWERCAVRTPFNHPAFIQAAGEAFGLKPLAMFGDEVGVIGLERSRGPVRALALTPGAAYSSPLLVTVPPEAEVNRRQTALDALREAVEGQFAQATFSLPPTWTDPRTFSFASWDTALRYTAVADLRDDPTAAWSKGSLQRARRHADAFRIEESQGAADSAAQLQAASYSRKDIPYGLSVQSLGAIARALAERGLARAFTATRTGADAPEAAALFAVDGGRAIYWLSGSEPGPAMTVLFLHAVRALKASGVTHLDLGGANVPGVAQFKRQLGGVLAPTALVRRIGPRWLRVADALR